MIMIVASSDVSSTTISSVSLLNLSKCIARIAIASNNIFVCVDKCIHDLTSVGLNSNEAPQDLFIIQLALLCIGNN